MPGRGRRADATSASAPWRLFHSVWPKFAGFWIRRIELRLNRAIQVSAGLRARAICRKMSASGQALAKTLRILQFVSPARLRSRKSAMQAASRSATSHDRLNKPADLHAILRYLLSHPLQALYMAW